LASVQNHLFKSTYRPAWPEKFPHRRMDGRCTGRGLSLARLREDPKGQRLGRPYSSIALVVVILPVVILPLIPARAGAMTCEEDSISDVSSSGAIIEMASGQIYKVDDADRADSSQWQAADDVLICGNVFVYQSQTWTLYTIINKDEDGEQVGAERLQ